MYFSCILDHVWQFEVALFFQQTSFFNVLSLNRRLVMVCFNEKFIKLSFLIYEKSIVKATLSPSKLDNAYIKSATKWFIYQHTWLIVIYYRFFKHVVLAM